MDIWPFDAFVGLFVFLIASQRAGEARMPEYWVGKFSVALLSHKFLLGLACNLSYLNMEQVLNKLASLVATLV